MQNLDPGHADAAPGLGADDVAAAHERDAALHRALRRLPPPLREIVALHYFQDLSLREIGAVIGIPPGTAKSRVNRALEVLRELLHQEEANHDRQAVEKAACGRP